MYVCVRIFQLSSVEMYCLICSNLGSCSAWYNSKVSYRKTCRNVSLCWFFLTTLFFMK